MDEWNEHRINVSKIYHQNMSNSEIKILSDKFDGSHVYHLKIVTAHNAEELGAHLERNGIGYGRHYPIPIHHLECFKSFGWDKLSFKNAEFIAYNSISLPVFPGMSVEEVECVCHALNHFNKNLIQEAS